MPVSDIAHSYPLALRSTFSSRVAAAGGPGVGAMLVMALKPLTDLVAGSATREQLENAMTALGKPIRDRYASALLFLKWTHPALPTALNETARALRDVLVTPTATDAQVQAALHALPLAAARANETALRKLVDERSGVEYIAIETLTGTFSRPGSVSRSTVAGGTAGIKYSTRLASIKAKLYVIAPTGQRYSAGFIQACTARIQRNVYADHGLETRWEIDNGFPVNDASGPSAFPFYHDGNSSDSEVGSLASVRDAELDSTIKFELTDDPGSSPDELLTYTLGTARASTRLKHVKRTQAFSVWFAYVRGDGARNGSETDQAYGERFRVLGTASYDYDMTVTVNWPLTGSTPTSSITEVPGTITSAIPTGTVKLPAAAMRFRIMNSAGGAGEDKCYAYRNGTRLGLASNAITVPAAPPLAPLPALPSNGLSPLPASLVNKPLPPVPSNRLSPLPASLVNKPLPPLPKKK
jgi:hypothetical protein